MSKKSTTRPSNGHAFRFRLATYSILALGTLVLAVTLYADKLNPDGISYLAIASHYAGFHLKLAINGYWGPLISWLLVPLLWLHVPGIFAFHLINAAVAVGTSLLFGLIVRRYFPDLSRRSALILECGLLAILLAWSLEVLTPDLLLSGLLLATVYLTSLFLENPTMKYAVLLGAAGGFLFFAKPIGLPLFVGTELLFFVRQLLRHTVPLRRMVVVGAVTAILAGPFCVLASLKYHRVIYTTSSAYNLAFISPQQQRIHPVDRPGVLVPPNSTAASVWEDPSYLPTGDWSPLKSMEDATYYYSQVHENVTDIAGYLWKLYAIFPLGLAGLAVTIALRKRPAGLLAAVALVFGTVLVGSYAAVVVVERHTWPLLPLLFVGLAGLTAYFENRPAARRLGYLIPAVGLAVSAAVFFPAPVTTQDLLYTKQAAVLQPYAKPGDRAMSDAFQAVETCYAVKLQCLGIADSALSSRQFAQLFARNHVKYLLLSGDAGPYQKALGSNFHALSQQWGVYEYTPNRVQ